MKIRFLIAVACLAIVGAVAKASAAGAPIAKIEMIEIPETTSTTSTTIPAIIIPGLDCPEWHDLAVKVGISIEDLPTVMKILHRESRCDPSVVNRTLNADGSWDWGLSQVNDRSWCLSNRWNPIGYLQARGIIETCEDLLDPEKNLRSMVELMRYSQDHAPCRFQPWREC